jgi:peptide/nickel transport system substrate-binding protein
MRKKLQAFVVMILLAALLAACGATATPVPAPTTAAPAPTTAAPAATTAAPAATTAAPVATTAAARPTTAAPAATTAAPATGGALNVGGGVSFPDPRPNYKKAPDGKKGGNLNLAISSDAKSFHPFTTTDATSSDWRAYIYTAALVENDIATGAPTPNFRVVTGLKVSEDKLTYTFTLKDNIKWSNGDAITAADYAWTYKQVLNPDNKYPYLADLSEAVESVTAVDPKTVAVKYKKAEIYSISQAGLQPLPSKVWEGKPWSDLTANTNIDTPTVVSGPWKLKEWKKGQFVTFERNDASTIWPMPLLDTVTIQIVPQRAVQVQKLKAGELDLVEITAAEYEEAKKATNAQVIEYFSHSTSWTYIGFNFRKAYLQDLALRQALAYATPQKDIVDKLNLGLGQPIFSTVPQSSVLFNPQTPKFEFSVDKAKQTLTAAGYKIAGGKLTDPKGQAIPKMKIYFNQDNKIREGIATVVQTTYKELGIDLEIVPLEFQAYVEFIKKEPYDYDLFILGWRSTPTPETFDQVWKGIPDLNSGAWDTAAKKKVVELYDAANKEFDATKRKEIMGQIQVETAKDLPYVFVFQVKNLVGVSNKFAISPTTNFGIGYNQFTDWSLK